MAIAMTKANRPVIARRSWIAPASAPKSQRHMPISRAAGVPRKSPMMLTASPL